MPNLTTNFNYNQPLVNNAIDADLWGGQLNTNWAALDSDLALETSVETNDFNVGTAFNTFYLIDASSNTVTATLPTSGLFDGFAAYFKATDVSNAVTIDGNGNTIDGDATVTINSEDNALGLVYDGTNWQIISANLTVNNATETDAGILAIATTAEAEAGTDDTKAITPLKAQQAILNINTTYGGVGSYVFAYRSSSITEDNTYAGSSLFPAGLGQSSVGADTDVANATTRGASSLSGTWRAMGRQRGSAATSATLFVRIV